MYLVRQNQTVSEQICVLSVMIRQLLDRYVYCLSVSVSFWTTGMCIVCQYQTGMCIVYQYLKGMCIGRQYQTYSEQVCVLSVSIRQFLDRYVYCRSGSDSF